MRFDREEFDDLGKGRILFELQKSYGGDDRFKLGKEFFDDIDEKLLPDKVILNIASSGIEETKYTSEEVDFEKEKNRYLDMIQTIFPKADLKGSQKRRKKQEYKVIQRYDPDAENPGELEQTEEIEQNNKVKKEKDKQKRIELSVKKGIDKKKKKIMKANFLLGKAQGKEKIRKAIKKSINFDKLKEIAKDMDAKTFSLFS